MTTENIGNINGTTPGSGARFNAGKPPLDLIPASLLAEYEAAILPDLSALSVRDRALSALRNLGEWQKKRGQNARHHLLNALNAAIAGDWSECAHVFGFGLKKYAAWNWIRGMAWSVPTACVARHVVAILRGQEMDADSGRHHLGHVACNIIMLLQYEDSYPQGDDRPPAEFFASGEANQVPAEAPQAWPQVERRAPRPKDKDLMQEAARALNDFGVHLTPAEDRGHNSAIYETWTPAKCYALKGALRAAAREGLE